MKIEMDGETSTAICVMAVCAVLIVLIACVYHYNVSAYERGYTQKQLDNSQQTMWVKAPPSN